MKALLILAFALVGLFFVSGLSYGLNQEDLDKLSATGQCLFCDLPQAMCLKPISPAKAFFPERLV